LFFNRLYQKIVAVATQKTTYFDVLNDMFEKG